MSQIAIGGRPTMNRRNELILLAGVLITGIATVLLGAALPRFRLKFGVAEAELGRLIAAQFAGGALAATASLRHPRFSLIAGFQFLALGLASTAFATWQFAPLTVLLYGIGLGLVLPSANMAVALAREHSRGASLSRLNLAWGLGAAATPLIFFADHGTNLLASIYLSAAVLAESIGIVLYFTFNHYPSPHTSAPDGGLQFDPRIAFHGLGFMLYIGAESCIGGWSSEYVFRTFGAPQTATGAISAFWIGLLAGRASAPSVLRRISETRLMRLSLALSLGGVVIMFIAPAGYVVVIGTAFVGLGMSSIYSLQVSSATAYAQRHRTRIPGWLFACGSIGGVTMPWFFGIFAEHASLRAALFIPIASLFTLLAVHTRTSAPQ